MLLIGDQDPAPGSLLSRVEFLLDSQASLQEVDCPPLASAQEIQNQVDHSYLPLTQTDYLLSPFDLGFAKSSLPVLRAECLHRWPPAPRLPQAEQSGSSNGCYRL